MKSAKRSVLCYSMPTPGSMIIVSGLTSHMTALGEGDSSNRSVSTDIHLVDNSNVMATKMDVQKLV